MKITLDLGGFTRAIDISLDTFDRGKLQYPVSTCGRFIIGEIISEKDLKMCVVVFRKDPANPLLWKVC